NMPIGIKDVATQADGRVLITHTAGNTAITRYNLDGTVDTSFGDSGSVTTVSYLNVFDYQHVLVQSDGRILVGGGYFSAVNGSDYELSRFNANGSPDSTFGVGGFAEVVGVPSNAGGASDVVPASIARSASGDIMIAGGRLHQLV